MMIGEVHHWLVPFMLSNDALLDAAVIQIFVIDMPIAACNAQASGYGSSNHFIPGQYF